jgi:hypothetical protein
VEEYSRLQTQFVNQLKETSTGIALPAQDFKRYSAVATFSDGDKFYSMIVCRILYGDMVHFLVLAKAYKSDNDNQTDTFSTNRTFRVGEDKKTIEETRSSSTANASRLDDGSVKTIYSSERFAQGAYSIAKSKRWSLGSLTETDFFGMNENAGVDTTIMSARQITYSLPISREMFRGYLPDRVRLFFDNPHTSHFRRAAKRDVKQMRRLQPDQGAMDGGRRAARPGLGVSIKRRRGRDETSQACACASARGGGRPSQSPARQ